MAGGWASVGDSVGRVQLCHPNEPGRPDCYHMVTVYHHELADCPRCQQEPYQPLTGAELHEAMINALRRLEQMVQDVAP